MRMTRTRWRGRRRGRKKRRRGRKRIRRVGEGKEELEVSRRGEVVERERRKWGKQRIK